MARQNEDTKHSKYVVRIVCEGQKTEPLFFTSLCDSLIDGDYYMGAEYDIQTIPQPDIPPDEEKVSVQRGAYKGNKRKTKRQGAKPQIVISGKPPLKWVNFAREKLSEGVDEAWAIFDKDEHPAIKEAFEEAAKEIDGKKVNIAFSSRSFEYYLLLHFEYIYHAFDATECGEREHGKKIYFHCMSENAVEKACHGERCINGYARKMNYWKETKTSESTFPLVNSRLRAGIINAHRLRTESDAKDSSPIYERNPYTNVDRLVCRLTNTKVIPSGMISVFTSGDKQLHIRVSKNIIAFYNMSKHSTIIPMGFFKKYDWKTDKVVSLNDKLMLQVQERSFCFCDFTDSEIVFIERCITNPEYIFLPDYSSIF